MEVHFSPDLQAKLDRVAAENSSDADGYVQQLVKCYVDHDVWFREQVKEATEQLNRGEFVTDEEMCVRIQQMFRS
jgi:predicted transcriptional regulator